MLTVLMTIVHVIVCLFLIIVVLLQSGKAADLAGAFGGMGSQTAFGPRGAATVLSKATTIAAALFMVTSMTLSILASRGSGVSKSVLDSDKPAATQSAPATPSPATPPATQGAAGAQPSVTLTDEATGASKTIPLDLDKLPKAPAPGGAQPGQAEKAPAKK
jgi:preprotein translocase subunit SecG